ncbi:hypothetical protein A9320_22235 [Ruegeria sp. PBVC088]|nr:hypothetical protein A9320_22235 [Ruegeria sp. PBVC088]
MTLSVQGKEFIKSLIHHTALIGDLRNAQAALLRVPRTTNGKRRAIFEYLDGEPVFDLEEILQRIQETYSIWEMILRDRREANAAEA